MSKATVTFLFLSVALLSLNMACSKSTTRTTTVPAIELASHPQLFVDDFLIERMEGVWRTLNRPTKFQGKPIVKPDRPWEGYLALQPGTVIYDEEEKIFKMWYNALATIARPKVEEFLCYATSRDGITWEKPSLNLVEFQGSKANNIVLKWSNWTHCVIKDRDDPDSNRRYKLAYWQTHDRNKCGIWVAFSSDGIQWNNYPNNPVVPCWATGDTFSVMRDPVSKQYFLYHKTALGPPRKVSRMVSDDFINWRDDRLVLEPDSQDQPDTEFYGLSAFPYAGQYLGLLWVFHTYPQVVDVQLVSSRDGLNWDRSVYRRIFLPLGYMINEYSGSSFDSGMVYPASAPLEKDDQLWIYYSGFSNLHNAPSPEHTGQIGLAKLRVDGFCSLDATSQGYLVTRPVKFQGSTMFVNAEVRRVEPEGDGNMNPAWKHLFSNAPDGNGSIRVEVQDEGGQAIAGYEASRCEPLTGNGIEQKVSWQGGKDLAPLKGQTVRFKFVLNNARLYSFKLK